MALKNIKRNSGFTIVELLIVIVVIAILATISIVAYNGVQGRAQTSAGQAQANSVIKKFEALNAVKGTYYSNTTAAGVTGANMNTFATAAPTAPEAVLDNAGSVIAATGPLVANSALSDTAAAKGTVVSAWACANGNGAVVFYWDYSAATHAAVKMVAGPGC